MSECTPTTEQVRNNMALGVAFAVIANRERDEELRAAAKDVDWPAPGLREDIKKTFDAWLAAEKAKWQAEERERIAVALEVLMRQHDLAQIGFSAIGDAYAHAARIARQGGSE